MLSFMSGMFAFLVSLGLSGWVRSRRFGLLTTLMASGALIALVYFLTAVVKGL